MISLLLLYFSNIFIVTSFHIQMENFLPQKVHNWRIIEPSKLYKGDLIYDYMNGAGEVYLSYNFQKLLVQRYSHLNLPEILVEIFDMQTPENAYGIFTNSQRGGTELNIGNHSEYKNGLLCFWKSKYFICIQIEQESEEAKTAIIYIAKHIADSIKDKGEVPDLVMRLPQNLFIKNSIRYFYRNEILNLHYFVASENILNLNKDTRAVLAKLKKGKSYFLIIKYQTKTDTEIAFLNFKQKFMPDAEQNNFIKTENNYYTLIDQTENFIMIVFDAKNPEYALDIINKVKKRLL